MTEKKVALIILDGWGIGDGGPGDAVTQAKTPTMDHLLTHYPSTHLYTYGDHVGLPDGQMGNSEVGHLNIGAGRVVYQDFAKINKSIRDGDFFLNPVLLDAFAYAKHHNKKVHILGLLWDGGVHAHQDHILALCHMAHQQELNDVYIHGFLDGRDTSPQSALWFVQNLEEKLQDKEKVWHLATLVGRYYAMDRDTRRERVKLAYDLLVHGTGMYYTNAADAIQDSYDEGVFDEFIKPIILDQNAKIQSGDVVIFANFRTDRPRELTIALTQQNFPDHDMKALDLYFCTMSNYDKTYRDIHVVFDKDDISMWLGEVVSKAGRTQLRIAETEKYPHVTFFFSGGREEVFEGEKRIVIPSPKVATYDLQPEMSAQGVTDAVMWEIRDHQPDLIILNFANPDMVGHTGDIPAVIQAVEKVDTCLGDIIALGKEYGYEFVVIADHGNADQMIGQDGEPHTAHTTNLVPCVIVSEQNLSLQSGKLWDIAPTILDLMNIPQPQEMGGVSLIQ